MKKINVLFNIVLTAVISLLSVNCALAFDFPKLNAKSKNIDSGFYKIDKINYVHDIYNAVELKDGRILIVGGGSLVDNKKNIEIFNPKTFKFSKVAKPVYNHYFQYNSVVLDNGKVLLMSDNDESGEDRVFYFETYDPKKNMFDDTLYSINGDCFGEIYKTKDGNAVVYCREYTDEVNEETKLYESVDVAHIYNYRKERFEKPLYPKDNGYIDQTTLANEDYNSEVLHPEGTVYIKIPNKNMILVTGIDIPEELRNAKTLEELKKSDMFSPLDNMSRKTYIFVYDK